MQGDFSRLTFDPEKHYRAVLMQQGRVQLDADWNEQIDILHHGNATLVRALLGDAGTPSARAGFALNIIDDTADSVDESSAKLPTPVFQISKGCYYVAGILCENEQDCLFAEQPVVSRFVADPSLNQFTLAYLDVWSRHVTAAEEPALRETALNGLDTTTRIQTVWQVRLLPLAESEQHLHNEHDRIAYEHALDLPEWRELLIHADSRSTMRARHDTHTALENQLYRIEIHSVQGHTVTFKWSRENASLLFALDTISEISNKSGVVQYNVILSEQLRDQTQLHIGDWVEFVTSTFALDGHTLPLYQVTDLPTFTSQHVTLTGARSSRLESLLKQQGQDNTLLLRCWNHTVSNENAAKDGAIPLHADVWLDLEQGIQVCFSPHGTYVAGDYWLITSRTLAGGIEWPNDEQGPLALPPHRNLHHHAPLALLHFQRGRWRVAKDLRRQFSSLPLITERIEQLHAQEPEQRPSQRLLELCPSDEELAYGELVAFVPASKHNVKRAGHNNARLLLGVIGEKEYHDEYMLYQVITYGRARCRVIGQVDVGDLLTVAYKHGYARAVGEENVASHYGTILGKALEAYLPDNDDASHLIDVFITLH